MSQTDRKTPLLSHFHELRRRLGWASVAVVIGVVIAFVFHQWIFFILEYPASGIPFIAITVTENMSTIMMVSFVGGVILAMPFIVYHGLMFVAPALTSREKKWVYIIVPWVFLMFLIGVAFGYFMLAPWTIWFLYSFGSNIAKSTPHIGDYVNFMAKLLLMTGLVFEMPVIATFLARLKILKPEWLAGKRAWAIILAFVAAAIITPPDPITQCLLAIPLILLYELSIFLSRLVYPKPKPEDEAIAEEG
jgi:sec-independent protein translocase protein TatC